jgi:hypothetical protein
MKKRISILLIAFLTLHLNAQTAIFNTLLAKNVDEKGTIDYKNIKKNEDKLDTYLDYLAITSPKKDWSANKTKAFWVNAYNAYTIKIVLENYPLKSILKIKKDGKNAWEIPFAKVGEKIYTLNHIEHEILRKNFKDPKIHVAVNCASNSCPKLGNFAFTSENYEAKTTALMREFINDTTRNKITKKKVQISEIFNWFKSDFTEKGSIIDFLNRYSETEITKNATLSYLKYDWSLNDK